MMIESLRLHRFRNYDEEIIRFPQSIIVLYGRNGQGKTNLLEALYMAGVGKSYRGMADNDLINWDKDDASLIVSFDRSGVQQQIKIILSKSAARNCGSMRPKYPKRNYSVRSTKSCFHRKICSSSRAVQLTATLYGYGNFPGQSGLLSHVDAV
jgi:recombinational DNA repair ATPase RecF